MLGLSCPAGGLVTYTIGYANVGSQAATGVVLTDVLGAYMTCANGCSGWNLVSGSTYTRSVGTVAAGGSGSVTIVAQIGTVLPAGVNTVTNTARIGDDGSQGQDPNIGNNTATRSTAVLAAPDMMVSKSDGGVTVLTGQLITYTVYYTNTGTRAASNVMLTETLPAHTGFIRGDGVWLWLGGSTYVQNVGTVNAGASGSRRYVVQVDPTLPAGVTSIINTVCLGDNGQNGPDLTPSNNCAWDVTPINSNPVLLGLQDSG